MNAKNNRASRASPLSAWVDQSVHEEISRRAERLGMTKSKYAGLVFGAWMVQGCPPVSRADDVMRRLEQEEPDIKTLEANEE